MRKFTLLILLFIYNLCIAQTYNAEYINEDTHIVFDGNRVETTYNIELKINNRPGTNFAEIPIYYKLDNPPKNLQAAIYDIFGNEIRKLKKKDITITTANGDHFHSDYRVQYFKLIHSSFPYIIKYSYTITEKDYLSLVYWSPYSHDKVLVKSSSVKLEVPTGTALNIFTRKIDEAQKETFESNDIYTWSIKNLASNKKEKYAPSYEETLPYVEVMPEQFNYAIKGNASSWKEMGNWECSLLDGLDKLTEEEAKIVHQLTDTISSDTEKIRILYHYMQDNTRYILVDLKQGGMIPHPATYVCTNKYGDCKALSNYMKALLKEAGIESIYTSVYAGSKPQRINPDFVSQQFNHIILCVPNNNDTIWLECTDKTSPFNYMGTFTQNRYVQLSEKDKSRLVKTPALTMDNSIQQYETMVTFNNENDGTFESHALLRGYAYDKFKSFETKYSEKEKQDYIDHTGFAEKADIKSFNINIPNRDSAFINLELNGSVSSLVENLGNKKILKPLKAINLSLETPEERINDIFISFPVNLVDSIAYTFTIPVSEIKGIKDELLQSEFGLYKRTVELNENQILVKRTFQLNQNYYSKDKYPEFYEFYKQALKLDQQKSIVTF